MLQCWACKVDVKSDDKVINVHHKLDGKETTAKICHLDTCLKNFCKWIYHPKFCPCPRCDGMIVGLGCMNCAKRIKENGKWTIDSFVNKEKQSTMQLFCSDDCKEKYSNNNIYGGICGVCGEAKLAVVCKQCNVVKYCSTECQNNDRTRHAKSCAEIMEKFICANCNKRSQEELLHCARCKKSYYCSKECQIAYWKKEHKLKCQKSKDNT